MNKLSLSLFITFCLVSTAALAGGPATVTGEFVRAWHILGPFEAEDVITPVAAGEEALSPSANAEVDGKAWKLLKGVDGPVNLEDEELFGHVDKSVGYAYAEIEGSKEADVMLGIGSDDAVVVWWNGRQVLVQDVLRGVQVGQDQVHVHMEQGRNTLLMKIFDDGGGFGFAADLRPVRDEEISWTVNVPLEDEDLLDLIEKRHFLFFWQEADPETGLIADQAPENGPNKAPCSVASLGFGLTAICIGDSRGWISRDEARERVLRSLRTMLEAADHERGFFYHFIDMKTAKRAWNSELSSIDTALFLAGALTCRNYFQDPDITMLVNRLYERIDWEWMLNGDDTFSLGWNPESGFIKYRWDSYSEHMILYMLALGAPARAIPADCWYAWRRPYFTYDGLTYVQSVPLFLHQYSHGWIDFKDKRDAYADYYKNSELATKAHKAFCLSLQDEFPGYSENLWGITASKGPDRYMVWGGPPEEKKYPIDGSVIPCAAGGSIVFTPDIVMPVLRNIYENYKDLAWGKYGYMDAFNPNTGWSAEMYIGIDVGATLLMIENHRSGNVWNWFMESREVQKGMEIAGFKDISPDLDPADEDYLRKLAKDTWACISHFVHPDTEMPYDSSKRDKYTSASNIGLYLTDLAAAREMGFVSEEEALARAGKLLESIEALPTWKGFIRCWHGVDDLAPSADDPWMSLVDSANLSMGLTVAKYAFPELHDRFKALLEAKDWSALYDTEANRLYGGYNMEAGALNPDWHIDMLATDNRAAAFMAAASGKVPAKVWDGLGREITERYHTRYLKPGWVGGGMFMQYITGIYLDEQDTLIGRSAANLAYVNMRHADGLGVDTWGWSSCLDPDGGYIGWGKLRDEVVTPHASALAIEDYPREVFANLLRLQMKGARADWKEDGSTYSFGFRDSIDVKTGKASDDYLVLDQSMLFLSLVNYLDDDIIRKWFHSDTGVQQAVRDIDELAHPEGGDNVSVFEPSLGKMVPKPQVARSVEISKLDAAPTIDGDLGDWPDSPDGKGRILIRFPEHSDMGIPPNEDQFSATIHVGWDAEYLFMGVMVNDDDLVTEAKPEELYKDDCIELFVDPQNDGLHWGDPADFQIGFSPSGPDDAPQVYAWFQKRVPDEIAMASVLNREEGASTYILETAIPWTFLGVEQPAAGITLGASVAVHTVNESRKEFAKINWSFIADGDPIKLGTWQLTE